MGLSITVLGCSGTWASAASACSGYLVSDGSTKVWVDCGPGTLTALQQHCRLEDLDAIVVTHEHPDHCLELPVVRNAVVHGGLDTRDIPLYAPRGVFGLLEKLVGSRGLTPAFIPKMVGDGSVARVGGIRMAFSRTDHPVETLAIRFDGDDGGAIGYSSDTGPGWSVRALGADLDVAVVEATLLHRDVGDAEAVHRTALQTGDDARFAGVGRLVITHVPPTGDGEAHRAEAEEAFGGTTILATPHERYDT